MVPRNWENRQRGTNMFKIMRKLKTVKHDIKDRSKKHFGKIHETRTRNAQKIEHVKGRVIA